ncbi:hypothetical protein QLS71_015560 [Mariniflexile litorale]|uniref:Universal stress protein family protein n=1 Tax=Mariniflexile litorale TaxID=3045158 RepID=A0AAU7EF22_9FLAO|nr:hypothetical protein [Mariniflexile sp. KMM 9835]MDQ8212439.1 hypothetical protein [Mariniflexile sp. KMM 9835]
MRNNILLPTDFSDNAWSAAVYTLKLFADTLAMVNYKHSFIEAIIIEPVIKKIGFHPMVPFLVIPE